MQQSWQDDGESNSNFDNIALFHFFELSFKSFTFHLSIEDLIIFGIDLFSLISQILLEFLSWVVKQGHILALDFGMGVCFRLGLAVVRNVARELVFVVCLLSCL